MPNQFNQLINVFAILIGVVGVFKAFNALHKYFENASGGRPGDGTEWAQLADAALFIIVGFGGFIAGLIGLIPTLQRTRQWDPSAGMPRRRT